MSSRQYDNNQESLEGQTQITQLNHFKTLVQMKNLLAFISIIFSVIATSSTCNVQAQAPEVGKTYYIQLKANTNHYLSTKAGKTNTRTRVVIDKKTTANTKATQWTLVNAGGGYFKFIQKSKR